MVSRRGQILGVLAGLLVLSGCSPAEGEETPTPPVSQSPTTEPAGDAGGDEDASGAEDPGEDPSQPPEVDAPERPAEMDEESVDGAIAAAKYFMELYPYIYATGDLTEWDALSDEGCRFCDTASDGATALHADRGYATGGEVEIYSDTGGGPYDDDRADDVYIVELGIRFAASVDHHADGSVQEHPSEEHPSFRLALIWLLYFCSRLGSRCRPEKVKTPKGVLRRRLATVPSSSGSSKLNGRSRKRREFNRVWRMTRSRAHRLRR